MVIPVIDETCKEVQLYLELEEKLLYPAVHRVLKEKHLETPENEFIHEGMSDHREIVQKIREIRGQIQSGVPLPMASDWDDQIDELIGLTEAYLNGEEKKTSPFRRKTSSPRGCLFVNAMVRFNGSGAGENTRHFAVRSIPCAESNGG